MKSVLIIALLALTSVSHAQFFQTQYSPKVYNPAPAVTNVNVYQSQRQQQQQQQQQPGYQPGYQRNYQQQQQQNNQWQQNYQQLRY